MDTLFNIVIATFLISLGAFMGVFTLAMNEKKLENILLFLVSLSAGALMGGAFLHLLPEAAEKIESENIFGIVLLSFIFFFFVEKLLHWRHCHRGHCDIHSFGYMNLFGDVVHNFIDGLIISAAFISDVKLGIVASLAIALHEIPQEIGDFGVLLYSGFKKEKALLANFLVAMSVILGGVVGYYLSFQVEGLMAYLLPFAAGGFIYISASDLMPEIRKEKDLRKSMVSFFVFLAGILMMYLAKFLDR